MSTPSENRAKWREQRTETMTDKEQKHVGVPCPDCGVTMWWPEGCPVDDTCNACKIQAPNARTAVLEVLRGLRKMAFVCDDLEFVRAAEIDALIAEWEKKEKR